MRNNTSFNKDGSTTRGIPTRKLCETPFEALQAEGRHLKSCELHFTLMSASKELVTEKRACTQPLLFRHSKSSPPGQSSVSTRGAREPPPEASAVSGNATGSTTTCCVAAVGAPGQPAEDVLETFAEGRTTSWQGSSACEAEVVVVGGSSVDEAEAVVVGSFADEAEVVGGSFADEAEVVAVGSFADEAEVVGGSFADEAEVVGGSFVAAAEVGDSQVARNGPSSPPLTSEELV